MNIDISRNTVSPVFPTDNYDATSNQTNCLACCGWGAIFYSERRAELCNICEGSGRTEKMSAEEFEKLVARQRSKHSDKQLQSLYEL